MKTRSYPVFTATVEEHRQIGKIAAAAVTAAKEAGIEYPFQDAVMDITACHANGCPLDLGKLLTAPASDFGHDVFGIRRFIDRSTGQLTQCFLPRCAK